MERKEFLSLMGITGVSVVATICLGACSKQSTTNAVAAAGNVDFILDLSLAANAALTNAGGYLYSNGVIVVRAAGGNYLAVSQACTHQAVTVSYQSASREFYCPSHGATFSENGTVMGGPANGALKQYQTTLTGNMLRVFG